MYLGYWNKKSKSRTRLCYTRICWIVTLDVAANLIVAKIKYFVDFRSTNALDGYMKRTSFWKIYIFSGAINTVLVIERKRDSTQDVKIDQNNQIAAVA